MSRKTNPKYIFVVGGVISGVGKGVTTSSIARILKDRGLRVTAIKIDPYVNVDAGTMNPTEHGEVFVLDDGYETDQDMGNYERFLNVDLPNINYMTTGRVYRAVIEGERNLKYGGRCVQVVPHIPLEIIRRLKRARKLADANVVVTEVGGTIGEYENILFLEAARMLKIKNPSDVLFVMVGYLPIPSKVGEMKTKPTQHAVRALNNSGIQPDIVIARSSVPLDRKRKEKLSFFCNIPYERVISAPDVDSIYDIPLNFERERLGDLISKALSIKKKKKMPSSSRKWKQFVSKARRAKGEIKIAIAGKYFDTGDFTLSDSYISVIEAIKYSAYSQGKKPEISWISAGEFEENPRKIKKLSEYDGIVVPGGFGERGIEGKLSVIRYARENKIPYLGLCYGMQLAIVEFARNVLGLRGATTREIDPEAEHLVIDVMEEQKEKLEKDDYGGTMRLGAYPAVLKKGTVAYKAYKSDKSYKTCLPCGEALRDKSDLIISERHRHRYEVNPAYIEKLTEAGLVFSGISPDGILMEIAELPKKTHPFFVGTQFHPEFRARPLTPHPLFTEFVKAAINRKKSKK